MSPPVLCYWDIRGLAQPIRLLLAYTETSEVLLSRSDCCWPTLRQNLRTGNCHVVQLLSLTSLAGSTTSSLLASTSPTCPTSSTVTSSSPRLTPSCATLRGNMTFAERRTKNAHESICWQSRVWTFGTDGFDFAMPLLQAPTMSLQRNPTWKSCLRHFSSLKLSWEAGNGSPGLRWPSLTSTCTSFSISTR